MKYTEEDVKNNNWIIINNKIYDISNWVDEHPGGDVIKLALGKDATEMFRSAGHIEDMLEIISYLQKGTI